MARLSYWGASPGALFWYRSPRNRILSGPSPIGKGTYPFQIRNRIPIQIVPGTPDPYGPYEYNKPWDSLWDSYYIYYQSSLRARFLHQGISLPGYLEEDWDEDPVIRQKPITYRAWNQVKTAINALRAAEGASAFNFTETIDANYVGPLDYRNQIAAALEVWNVAASRIEWPDAWENAKIGIDTSWADAQTAMLADAPYQDDSTYVRFSGGEASGDYTAQANRVNLIIENESSDPIDTSLLPDSPSDNVLQVQLYRFLETVPEDQEKYDDWARSWEIKFYKVASASYDASKTLLGAVDKDDIPTFIDETPNFYPQVWLHIPLGAYIDLSEDVENCYMATFTHDALTSGNGSFSFPSAPGTGEYLREGVYVWEIKLLQYVNDVADIGSTA